MFKVVEIFDSIEGEGKRAGMCASFVRLAGCNLRCSYCDTLYALEPCDFTVMTIDEICKKCTKRAVTLTGGEPLLAAGIEKLCAALLADGHFINIETNGAADIMEFLQKLPFYDERQLFFTIDYKLPSSGFEDKMIWENFESLTPRDVIKFVVGSREDFARMLEVIERIKPYYEPEMPKIYIGAVFDKMPVRELAEMVIAAKLPDEAYFQLQLHKYIWDADARGV